MPDDLASQQGLYVRRQFFDDHLRGALLAESEHRADEAGAIFRNTDTMVDEGYRRCRVVGMSPGIAGVVASRFDGVMPELEAHFRIRLEGFQHPRLLRYRKGDFFVAHQDSDAQGPPWLRDRKITAVVFVNSQQASPLQGDYRGGMLTLYRLTDEQSGEDARTRVPVEPGLLIAFRASLFHEVSRVTQGERYSVVTWFG